eukprot:m.25065 g.25065  ORF g.25065 m.25065 type:complete len:79 (-) comp7671_c0_seq1:505-741(-)
MSSRLSVNHPPTQKTNKQKKLVAMSFQEALQHQAFESELEKRNIILPPKKSLRITDPAAAGDMARMQHYDGLDMRQGC